MQESLPKTKSPNAGFIVDGVVSGKIQSREFPGRENRNIASLTPVSVSLHQQVLQLERQALNQC
jgi:hypothetical protein